MKASLFTICIAAGWLIVGMVFLLRSRSVGVALRRFRRQSAAVHVAAFVSVIMAVAIGEASRPGEPQATPILWVRPPAVPRPGSAGFQPATRDDGASSPHPRHPRLSTFQLFNLSTGVSRLCASA